MQLLVLILKKVDLMNVVLKNLAELGVRGGTILEGTGMAKTLASMDELPLFGMLRQLTNAEYESSKVLLLVLNDEEVMPARRVIKKVVDLSVPNSGIMFSIPLTYVEGLGK